MYTTQASIGLIASKDIVDLIDSFRRQRLLMKNNIIMLHQKYMRNQLNIIQSYWRSTKLQNIIRLGWGPGDFDGSAPYPITVIDTVGCGGDDLPRVVLVDTIGHYANDVSLCDYKRTMYYAYKSCYYNRRGWQRVLL